MILKNYLINITRNRKKNCIVVKVPEGVKEISGMANLSTYDKVILPKSLKKVNVGGVFSDLTERVVFLGDKVPEFTGEMRYKTRVMSLKSV